MGSPPAYQLFQQSYRAAPAAYVSSCSCSLRPAQPPSPAATAATKSTAALRPPSRAALAANRDASRCSGNLRLRIALRQRAPSRSAPAQARRLRVKLLPQPSRVAPRSIRLQLLLQPASCAAHVSRRSSSPPDQAAFRSGASKHGPAQLMLHLTQARRPRVKLHPQPSLAAPRSRLGLPVASVPSCSSKPRPAQPPSPAATATTKSSCFPASIARCTSSLRHTLLMLLPHPPTAAPACTVPSSSGCIRLELIACVSSCSRSRLVLSPQHPSPAAPATCVPRSPHLQL